MIMIMKMMMTTTFPRPLCRHPATATSSTQSINRTCRNSNNNHCRISTFNPNSNHKTRHRICSVSKSSPKRSSVFPSTTTNTPSRSKSKTFTNPPSPFGAASKANSPQIPIKSNWPFWKQSQKLWTRTSPRLTVTTAITILTTRTTIVQG